MVRFHKPTALLGLCCCFWQQPASAHDREGSVFLTSGQGGSVKRISVVDSTDTPCWMPDGQSILYVAHTSSENTIHLVSTSGEKLRTVPIPPPIVTVGGISIAPDGTELLLSGRTADPEGTFDIYRMKLGAEDPELELIVPDGIFPLWSPNGGHFIITTFRNGNMELFVADRNGQNLRNLTQHEKYDGRGTWSPDGERIAFESDRFGNIDLCVVDVASGDVDRLTDYPGEDREPSWSRNGEIAFASDRNGRFCIYSMASDGTEMVKLTSGNYDRQPVWSPDGDSLCFTSRLQPLPDAVGK